MLTHAFVSQGDSRPRRPGAGTEPRITASGSYRLAGTLQHLFVVAILAFSFSCSSKPADPRTVIPNDALVYLESKDLGIAVRAITENSKFQNVSKTRADLSPLDGVRLAVAITGFETSEEAVTDENAVVDFQPRFVAVIETNAWGWQTTKFVENGLGEFVNEAYGGAVELEITTRKDGEFHVWTSESGRKAYALQQGSLVFFGNDESAIEQCQAVRRGEAESIANNAKIVESADRLAFGYVSPEGVAQIANIAGVSLAMSAGEEAEVKSFVAGVLPVILRNSLKDLTWTATKVEAGIEDKFVAALDQESSRVFDETLTPGSPGNTGLGSFLPAAPASATRYLLRDPQVAWRSILITAQKKTDETSGVLIGAFAGSVFEPYGVEDAEVFLSAIGPTLFTVKLASDSEDAAVIATIKDLNKVKTSIAKEINITRPPNSQFGAQYWGSEDGELAAAIVGDVIIAGDAATVLKCLEAKQSGIDSDLIRQFASSDAVATTVANQSGTLDKMVGILAGENSGRDAVVLTHRTETRFNRNGIERRTISDFGFIGWLIESVSPSE